MVPARTDSTSVFGKAMLGSSWRMRRRSSRKGPKEDLFPSKQLFVLALCRICEPIAFMSIFPYAYQMIESFDGARDRDRISIYAGLLITAFAFAEFCSGVVWGRISDQIGRRPVLICGLMGTALSQIMFGFATNIQTAVVARALGGLLNGNLGVLQTTVAELVTVKEHEPLAFSIMPFVWCLGSIVGPALGGSLAQPCDSYPSLFSRDSIFSTYPFLLPNLVCFIVLTIGIVIGLTFLQETHPEKKHDPTLAAKLGGLLGLKHDAIYRNAGMKAQAKDEHAGLLAHDKLLQEQISGDGSARIPDRHYEPGLPVQSDFDTSVKALSDRSVCKTFTKQIVLIIIAYGLLAYHSVSFDILVPMLLSEPVSDQPADLPFRFSGGFAMSTKKIGVFMTVQAIYSLPAQIFLFPYLVGRLGTLVAFRGVLLLWPLLYFAVPYLVLMPKWLQEPGIYACLLIKITLQVVAFPAVTILLTNAASSTLVLGSINGVAASIACMSRAFGPVVTGLLHTWGLKMDCNGVGWWAGGLICAAGAAQSFWLNGEHCHGDEPRSTERSDCSADLHPSSHEILVQNNDQSTGSLDDRVKHARSKSWEG